jgi:hypothetical protein
MKNYVNGKAIQLGETQKAREILLAKGIYQTLGNFGAYTPNKLSRLRVKEIETFVEDGFEFRIIESEVMSFSLSTLEVSKPHTQKECWYQPI